jgi:flagellar basal-body rod protein FlgB
MEAADFAEPPRPRPGADVVSADLPLMSMLKTRMQWHQSRQRILAENVANADTPGFKPSDLKEPAFARSGAPVGGALPVALTSAGHLAGAAARPGEDPQGARRFETTPSGNSVSLEEEMLKSAQNQSDFQLAASMYAKSLQMLRTAVGRR